MPLALPRGLSPASLSAATSVPREKTNGFVYRLSLRCIRTKPFASEAGRQARQAGRHRGERTLPSGDGLVVLDHATEVHVAHEERREPLVLALEGEGELVHRPREHLSGGYRGDGGAAGGGVHGRRASGVGRGRTGHR